jgi:four helix bundle protein
MRLQTSDSPVSSLRKGVGSDVRKFRNIVAWQKADDLVVQVYELTKSLPRSEVYGLTSQMRRAAVSVAANIAEGSARPTSKDYIHYLSIAKSSLVEVEYYLHISHRLGYLDSDDYHRIAQVHEEAAKVLYGLTQYIQSQMQSRT